MRRTLLLIFAILVSIVLATNSTKRILSLRTTSQSVQEAEKQLEQLKQDNQALKQELEYKKSEGFIEKEFRNRLGLAREGEAVVILPRENSDHSSVDRNQRPEKNWQKWWNHFFGS